MKKLAIAAFTSVMILSMVFISESIPGDSSFSAQAQTTKRHRRAARRGHGIWAMERVRRGGEWVTICRWHGIDEVGRRTRRTGRKAVGNRKKRVRRSA